MPKKIPDEVRESIIRDLTADPYIRLIALAEKHGVNRNYIAKLRKDAGLSDIRSSRPPWRESKNLVVRKDLHTRLNNLTRGHLSLSELTDRAVEQFLEREEARTP